MSTPEPLLSVVVTSCNDDRGGSRSEVVFEELGVLRDRRLSGRFSVEAAGIGTPLRRIGCFGFARADQ
jgi:hypothetical protein